MKANEDFSIDFESLEQKISIPLAVAENLEVLDQALNMLSLGKEVDLGALSGSLFPLAEWMKTRPSPQQGSRSAWKATYFGSPDLGGMLTCRKEAQELIFSLDPEGIPYLGIWNIQLPGKKSRGTSFKIENTPEGMQLILEDGKNQKSHKLPGAEGLLWGTLEGFLKKVNPPQTTPAAPAPSADAGTPLPPAQPAKLSYPPLSPPSPATPHPPKAAAEAAFCTNCGAPLKPGKKFCGKCGTPVAQ